VREIRTLRLTRRGLETGREGTAPVLDPTDEGGLATAATARLLRHRQTKGAETDRPGLTSQKPALYSTHTGKLATMNAHSETHADIGLAVMGQNLVLNMNDHGYRVAVYNRTVSRVSDFLKGTAGDR